MASNGNEPTGDERRNGSEDTGPRSSRSSNPPPARRRDLPWLLVWVGLLIAIFVIAFTIDTPQSGTDLTYTEFLGRVDAGTITSAKISPDGKVTGTLSDGTTYSSRIPTIIAGEELGQRLEAKGVTLEGKASSTGWSAWILAFAPVLLLVGAFIWMARRSRGASG